MQTNEDRELQIELVSLGIKHEYTISMYTIFLSVVISMMTTVIVVYAPLGLTTGNLLYIIVAALYTCILLVIVAWGFTKMGQYKQKIEREIQEIKKKYLW